MCILRGHPFEGAKGFFLRIFEQADDKQMLKMDQNHVEVLKSSIFFTTQEGQVMIFLEKISRPRLCRYPHIHIYIRYIDMFHNIYITNQIERC